jgi:hypothetical protein
MTVGISFAGPAILTGGTDGVEQSAKIRTQFFLDAAGESAIDLVCPNESNDISDVLRSQNAREAAAEFELIKSARETVSTP